MRTWPFRSNWVLAALLVALACSLSTAQTTSSSRFNGRWEANGLPAGPWIFELTTNGNAVTGRVMQHGGVPGPAAILEGKVDGDTIVFKSRHPAVSNVKKEVTLKGVLSSDAIAFQRSVEILLDGPNDGTIQYEVGLFGTLGPTTFSARRVGPVPKPPTPVERASGPPMDVTGKWESLRWNMDLWYLELKSDAVALSGTVGMTRRPGMEQLNQPAMPIYEAKVDGNTVSFKTRSPDNVRTISFTGLVRGDEMSVERVVEVPPGGASGFEEPSGIVAPLTFVVRRLVPGGQPESPELLALKQARTTWANARIKDYEFTMEWRCLCPYPVEPLSYRVTNDTGAYIQNPTLMNLLALPPQGVRGLTERYSTIDKLFDFLNAAAMRRPYAMTVAYDPKFGFPVSVDLDPGGTSVDDDIQIRIRGFRTVN